MQSIWKKKEPTRTQRLQGEKWRWKELKQRLPRQKQAMEMRARIQRSPSSGATMPRPR
jgi:hypothetical protein